MPTTQQSQEDFDGLWGYLWGALNLSDEEAQAMARQLMSQGVKTWEQFATSHESI